MTNILCFFVMSLCISISAFPIPIIEIEEEPTTREETLQKEINDQQQEINLKDTEIAAKQKQIKEQNEELERQEKAREYAGTLEERNQIDAQIKRITGELDNTQNEKAEAERAKLEAEKTQKEYEEIVEKLKEGLEKAFEGSDDNESPSEEDDVDKCSQKFFNGKVVLKSTTPASEQALKAYIQAFANLTKYEYLQYSKANFMSEVEWNSIEQQALESSSDDEFIELIATYRRAKAKLEQYINGSLPGRNNARIACQNNLVNMVKKTLDSSSSK